MRQRGCDNSPEPSLLAVVIVIKLSRDGSVIALILANIVRVWILLDASFETLSTDIGVTIILLYISYSQLLPFSIVFVSESFYKRRGIPVPRLNTCIFFF